MDKHSINLTQSKQSRFADRLWATNALVLFSIILTVALRAS